MKKQIDFEKDENSCSTSTVLSVVDFFEKKVVR